MPGQKPMAGEVTGNWRGWGGGGGEPTASVLLNGFVVKLPPKYLSLQP